MFVRQIMFAMAAGIMLMGDISSGAIVGERDLTDEQTLQSAGLSTDGPALLSFFQKRSQPLGDRVRIAALIQQLKDPSRETRDQAMAELISLGAVAVPLLRQAVKDPDDREIAGRARHCLRYLEGETGSGLTAAAARLVAKRRPAGAASTLLVFLPFAEDETVLKEVQTTLTSVAYHDGRPDPFLIRAINDPVPLCRAVAAEVLVSTGGAEQWASVQGLLRDPKPMVRLRVGLALGSVHWEEAIPVLIALLTELPVDPAKQAEEFLINLAGDQAPKLTLGKDDSARQKCREAWAKWWQSSEGAALLDEFRKRTLSDDLRNKLQQLIRQLGDESFQVREKATTEILALGKTASFLLRQAASDSDAEISQRAQKCLSTLERGGANDLPIVAARLVALRKPAGATEVLLGYLPFAEDESTALEVQSALATLAFRDGKPDPVLVQALEDKQPLRRAASAEALSLAGGREQWPVLRRLLHDADSLVRLRVALALTSAADKEAVPVLIALLSELPLDQAWRAEDCLYRLAGDRSPRVPLGSDPASRQKCRDAWTAWWREQGPNTELVKTTVAPSMLGYTLIVQMDNNGTGRVMELGAGGKPRWQIDGLQYPVDAHVLPGNRVLIVEYNANRVTERDFKGTVLWEKQLNNSPVNAQRLPNGNTFIAVENQLIELDRSGKQIFAYDRPNHDVNAAIKMRNGQIHLITSRSTYHKLDASGKEIKTFPVGQISYTSGFDVLPNGRILVPQYSSGKVIEYDTDGKAVWEASQAMPNSATRLPNGHTLVSSHNSQKLVELDRSGKVVWEHKQNNSRPWRARRR